MGIHVMVSQNGRSELTIADSHEYGVVHDPFDKQEINQLILDYLKSFDQFKDQALLQTWNGIYPKQAAGKTEFIYQPKSSVTIINGLGGGTTLTFGLTEEIIKV